jgi:Tfp pilus assembly protein PilF
LLLLDYWPLNRLRLKRLEPATAIQPHVPIGRLVLEKLPMLVLVVAAAAWTMILQRAGNATELTAELTFGQRTANAVVAVWRYVGKLVAPVELSPFYPHPGSWPNAVVMASAAGVVLVSVVVVLAARRRPYLLVGWCWFLGMLFPVSGVLVHAGRQSIADRYMYLPGLGLLIGVVWLFDSMIRGRVRWQITAAGVTGVLAVVYASLTARYQQLWQNDVTLYSHALQVDGKNWFAAQVLGRQLKAAGQPELAADYFRRSLAVSPGNQRLRLEFATLLLMMMPPQPEEAAREFRELVRAAPNHPGSWVGLARAELAAGRPDAAEAAFVEADRRWPDLPDVQAQWSLALARMGRMEEARRRAAVALQADPTNEVARLVLSGGATSRPASP